MLKGRVAIVTGGTGGIGKVTCFKLANEGAKVVIQYNRHPETAMEILNEIKKIGADGMIVKIDFSNFNTVEKEIEEMVEKTIKRFGKIDILVCLHGYPAKGEWNKKYLDLKKEDFYKPLDVDYYGTFLLIKAVSKQMLKQKKGSIINITSTPALEGHDRGLHFSGAKAGIRGLTKSFAVELAPYVRVNELALGNIATEWLNELTEKEKKEAEKEALLKRFGKPEDVANAILFFASDLSDFITGQTLIVDGGTVRR